MAYIILHVAFNIVEGIGIDTHMHRIFNVLGWVSSKQPEQTRVQLESWLPREEWDAINILFVGLGTYLSSILFLPPRGGESKALSRGNARFLSSLLPPQWMIESPSVKSLSTSSLPPLCPLSLSVYVPFPILHTT